MIDPDAATALSNGKYKGPFGNGGGGGPWRGGGGGGSGRGGPNIHGMNRCAAHMRIISQLQYFSCPGNLCASSKFEVGDSLRFSLRRYDNVDAPPMGGG